MDNKILLQDLAKSLAAENAIDKKEAQTFTQTFFDVILNALKKEKYVKIKGWGTFKLVEVERRESVNIQTGERFEIPVHAKISFTPDAALKDIVNKPFAHFETVPLNENVTESDFDSVDTFFGVEEEQLEQEPKQEIASEPVPEPIVKDLVSEPESEPEVIPESKPEVVPEPVPVIEETTPEPDPVSETVLASGLSTIQESEMISSQETEPSQKHSKYYIWFAVLLGFLALAIGYLIGTLRESSIKPKEVVSVVYDTIYIEKQPKVDSTRIETEPVIRRDETTPTVKPVTPKQKQEQPKQEQEKKVKAKKETPKPEVQKEVTKTTDYSKYPQLPGGAYWIVGTAQTYTMRGGETIRIIAERFFGSRQMAPYIIKYNGVSDPDHVAAGTVLNIPKLESKRK